MTDGQTGRRRQPCQQLDLYKSTVAKKLSASALCRLADCELTVVDVCSIVMNRCQRDDIVVLAWRTTSTLTAYCRLQQNPPESGVRFWIQMGIIGHHNRLTPTGGTYYGYIGRSDDCAECAETADDKRSRQWSWLTSWELRERWITTKEYMVDVRRYRKTISLSLKKL